MPNAGAPSGTSAPPPAIRLGYTARDRHWHVISLTPRRQCSGARDLGALGSPQEQWLRRSGRRIRRRHAGDLAPPLSLQGDVDGIAPFCDSCTSPSRDRPQRARQTTNPSSTASVLRGRSAGASPFPRCTAARASRALDRRVGQQQRRGLNTSASWSHVEGASYDWGSADRARRSARLQRRCH